jgi:ATP-dependent DNA ligase
MKPMLCHRYEKYRRHIRWPWYVQPKLNGIRLLYQNGVMQSRSYGLEEPRTWPEHRLQHIRTALAGLAPHLMLDGELYVHGWSLQKINGAAAINGGADSERSALLEYHVFDVVNLLDLDEVFAERAVRFPYLRTRFVHPIHFVETVLAEDEISGDGHYSAWKSLGYEGAVYKDPEESYGFVEFCGNKENRWRKTLKRKDYIDETCRIIAVYEGEGKFTGMVGSFRLELPNGKQFNAGSGLYDSQRMEYWEHPPLGVYASVKFLNYSDDGIPKEPVIVAIFD